MEMLLKESTNLLSVKAAETLLSSTYTIQYMYSYSRCYSMCQEADT